ncbi:APC family permease [Virgibacillus sp. W0181]|uniref:APC family permease n=1 Tax=Virgibacillus sp. W0181 TaxID=3391581 RepID=UPI003F481B99
MSKSMPKQQATTVFTRNATGLVRDASGFDSAFYNLLWSSIPLATIFILSYGYAYYVGANLYLTTLLCGILCLPTAFLYAMMSSAMPRSGADYVWGSRSVHPLFGFMSNWNFVVWMLFFIGLYSTYLAEFGLSTLFRVLAAFTGSPNILALAEYSVQPLGIFIIGITLVLLSGAMFIFGTGLKTFMRIQRWGFALYLIGAIILPIIVIFIMSRGFPEAFNSYMSALNIDNAYDKVIESGAFVVPEVTSTKQTILAMTLPLFIFGNIFQSAYFSGEIKRGKGIHTWAMPGALGISVVIVLLLIFAYEKSIGKLFLGSATLAPVNDVGYSFMPTYVEMAAISSGNMLIAIIIALGLVVQFALWVPQTIISVSRSLFAWSFDGLVSRKVSSVNEKTRSPVVAVSIIGILSCFSVALSAFVPGLTLLTGLLGVTMVLVFVSIAGIFFPYKQPDTWKGSAFNGKVFGFPTISVVGALSLIAMLFIVGVLLMDPNSGTSWITDRKMVYIVLIIYLGSIPFYFISKWIQRSKGVDISLSYKEIPPE